MNDILLIDKPTGMTSHDVVNIVRHKTGIKRVGHAGTLDPLASGLLIILVGRAATKQQSTFLHQDKAYECTGQLGVTSDTYDATGKVEAVCDWSVLRTITKTDVEQVLHNFQGKLHQRVPAFSAVKVHGQKLYHRARRSSIDISELPVKEIEIFDLLLTDFVVDDNAKTIHFSLRVHCSSGTYIRSLIHDIGEELNVGAMVTRLRRTHIGEFRVGDAQAITSLDTSKIPTSQHIQ